MLVAGNARELCRNQSRLVIPPAPQARPVQRHGRDDRIIGNRAYISLQHLRNHSREADLAAMLQFQRYFARDIAIGRYGFDTRMVRRAFEAGRTLRTFGGSIGQR